MKNAIVGFLTLVIFGLMGYTFMQGPAYHGGEQAKVIDNLGDKMSANKAGAAAAQEKDDRKKEMDKLNALRDKAGNAGNFKVSDAYKSKCSSCHGANGMGEQNGKALMGPKLFGQKADKIYKDLTDFKSGRRENLIMKGLLMGLGEEELRVFADEIGEFPARAKAQSQE